VLFAVINNNLRPARLLSAAPTSSVGKLKVSAAVGVTQDPKLVAVCCLSSPYSGLYCMPYKVARNKEEAMERENREKGSGGRKREGERGGRGDIDIHHHRIDRQLKVYCFVRCFRRCLTLREHKG